MATVPPNNFVEPAELTQYGVPGAFLQQFRLRAFQINIETGGALGAMFWQWRWKGDTDWSDAQPTDDLATFLVDVVEAFALVTFAAATYVVDTVYTVTEAGVVTGGSGITTSRYDLRAKACSAVSAEALVLLSDAIHQPLLVWGDDARGHAAMWAWAKLLRFKGASPASAADGGDVNVFLAEEQARNYFAFIGKNGRPASMTDTPLSEDGPLIPGEIISDDPIGW